MNAENDDSIKLLKECDAGTKMAISSLDEVLEKVSDPDVKQILTESKGHHEKLRDEISDQLMVKNSVSQRYVMAKNKYEDGNG